MNRRDIHMLQKIKGSPAVTITLPVHRFASGDQQERIRVKNLVKQATDQLRGDYARGDSEPIIAKLEKLAENIDFGDGQDGLAIFVNRDFDRALNLAFPVKERLAVADTFLTRELIFAMNRAPRYWLLVLSEKPTRLLEGTRDQLIEVKAGNFPMTYTGPGSEKPATGSFGIRRTAIRDERHRQFLRQVDGVFRLFLAEDPLPLAVVGENHFLALFDEVTAHKASIVARLDARHDETPPPELGQLVWPAVKAGLADRRLQVLAGLGLAINENKLVPGIADVWRLAKEGHGRLLLVEENFHFRARVDETGERLQAFENPSAPGVIEDAVDEIIETVLTKQGQVVFVDNDRLETYQRIALILQ